MTPCELQLQYCAKVTQTNFDEFPGFSRKFRSERNFRELSAAFSASAAYYSKVLSTFCCNALQKYSKSVSSTQVTILSLLPVETSLNVWLLVWYEQPGVRVSVQTTTQSLQARGLELGAIFYDLLPYITTDEISRFVGETPREGAWRKLFRHHSPHQTCVLRLRSKFTSFGETEKAVHGSKSFRRPIDA